MLQPQLSIFMQSESAWMRHYALCNGSVVISSCLEIAGWRQFEPLEQLLISNHYDDQPWKTVPSGLSKPLALSAWHGWCPWEKKPLWQVKKHLWEIFFFFRWLRTLLETANTVHCNCSIVLVRMQRVSLHKAKMPNFSLDKLLMLCNKIGLRKKLLRR